MLKQRIITALILAPIVIAGIFLLDGIYFALFIGIIIVIGAWEWANLAGIEGKTTYIYAAGISVSLVLAWYLPATWILSIGLLWWCLALILVVRYPMDTRIWGGMWQRSVIGVMVLVPAWVSLQQLKTYENSNFLILLLMFLIWGADIGAYFTGRAFGNKKLAPAVSPGKSWAGLYGGMFTAVLIVIAMTFVQGDMQFESKLWWQFFAICMFVTLISVLGDLTESMFKRYRGIKDSSNLLPGHGGILDRIDSLVAAGPVYALLLIVIGWK
ncbi:MAG: phosphatidate cytidylyltransferase [Gammaproteobacteria bacterium]|nr:phosphatidate cytidylyltransferase [Gammaproteobacteria bacterium]